MREPVVGIDLGTSTSAVATLERGRPKVIPSRAGSPLTPSLVGFTPHGDRVVGEAARALAEHHPENVAAATKRFIGRRFTPELAAEAKKVVTYPLREGPAGEVRIELAGQVLPITQLSAMILGELKLDAQAYFGRPVSKAVITVPANFDDLQRKATREAAAIAGIEVLRIVNEPTAAAVAYGLKSSFEGRALVFDLGGGTFDVSILEVEKGVFQVKATGGDPYLGGEDFDNQIVQWLLAQVPDGLRPGVAQDPLSLQRLKVAAEKAKRDLTASTEALISVAGLGNMSEDSPKLTDLDTALTRDFFETLSHALSRRCLKVCERLMGEVRQDPRSVDAVLLVGGMTRVPHIRRLVAEYFGKEPVGGINPDEAVALGAAVHASEIHSSEESRALLLDVVSHSLGVGTAGGGVRCLVRKNTAIPVVAKQIFLPGTSYQTAARIPIYQGEADHAEENTKLGELVLRGLASRDRANVPLEVTFELSSEGTLSVRAVDTTTGTAEALQIEARTELSPTEVKRLAKEQKQYATQKAAEDDVTALQMFALLLDRGERLRALLEKSAEENPSQDAVALVTNVKQLLEGCRAAQEAKNRVQMAELGQKLNQLVSRR